MRLQLALAACLAIALTGCGEGDSDNASTKANAAAPATVAERRNTIGEALSGSADHSAFLQALQTGGLAETLRGAGPYTVFAPTNAAFGTLPTESRADPAATEPRERLVRLLSNHIVPGTVTEADLRRALDRGQGRAELATMSGENLSLSLDGDTILIGNGGETRARLTRADQIHSNGVSHGVDAVLTPPSPAS